MKLKNLWTLLLATVLFAACGGEDHPTNPPYDQLPADAFSISITNSVAEQTSITFIIKTTGAASYGYIAEPHREPASEYTAEQIFTNVFCRFEINSSSPKLLSSIKCSFDDYFAKLLNNSRKNKFKMGKES